MEVWEAEVVSVWPCRACLRTLQQSQMVVGEVERVWLEEQEGTGGVGGGKEEGRTIKCLRTLQLRAQREEELEREIQWERA